MGPWSSRETSWVSPEGDAPADHGCTAPGGSEVSALPAEERPPALTTDRNAAAGGEVQMARQDGFSRERARSIPDSGCGAPGGAADGGGKRP